MGKVLSSLAVRPIKNFNVENRAEKVISQAAEATNKKSIPRTAPKHPTSVKYIEQYIKEHPEVIKAQQEKPKELLDWLRSVKVVSHDTATKPVESTRQLPQERRTIAFSEYGYHEPLSVPPGKVSLKQALEFLTNHQQDKQRWDAQTIAREYNLEPGLVQQVLKHFRAFNVYLPADKLKEAEEKRLLSTDAIRAIKQEMHKKIGSGTVDKDSKNQEEKKS